MIDRIRIVKEFEARFNVTGKYPTCSITTPSSIKFAEHIATLARADALEEAANECEREMMFPGGRQESYAHHGVHAAAKAIRALKDKEAK